MAVTAANVRALEGAIKRSGVANATINMGDAYYIADDQDNILPKVAQADANVSAALANARGIVVAVVREGETQAVAGDGVTLVTFGPVGGFSGLTPGARQFISSTAGGVTETAPTGAGTWTQPIGYAESDSVLFVAPGLAAPASNS